MWDYLRRCCGNHTKPTTPWCHGRPPFTCTKSWSQRGSAAEGRPALSSVTTMATTTLQLTLLMLLTDCEYLYDVLTHQNVFMLFLVWNITVLICVLGRCYWVIVWMISEMGQFHVTELSFCLWNYLGNKPFKTTIFNLNNTFVFLMALGYLYGERNMANNVLN